MNLYMFHCGHHVKEHIYEQHVNFFIVAENAKEARIKVDTRIGIEEANGLMKIHIDSMIKIESVGGYRIVPDMIRTGDQPWESILGEITD